MKHKKREKKRYRNRLHYKCDMKCCYHRNNISNSSIVIAKVHAKIANSYGNSES